MADELPSEEAKIFFQAKLDGLDVETLQKLLQTALANKTNESEEHNSITPATPSSTPVEVSQTMNNLTIESHSQEESVDGGDDGAEIQINAGDDDDHQARVQTDDDVDTLGSNDVLQNILPDNHGDGSFSSPFNQQINEVPVLESAKTSHEAMNKAIITTPKSQESTNNHQVLHDLTPASDKPNHPEILDQTSHETPHQASPGFIPLDDQSTNLETERDLKPTSASAQESHVTKSDKSSPNNQFNSPLISHQPSTNFDQPTQSWSHDQKPFVIPAQKHTILPEKSSPNDQFNSPLTSHQPSNNFDQPTQSGSHDQKPFVIPAQKHTILPETKTLPNDQFNTPLTSHQPSTKFDKHTQSGHNQNPFGIPAEKHTTQPYKSLPNDQFNTPLTSHQPSTSFDQHNKKPTVIPAEKPTTRPNKDFSKELQNPFASSETQTFESKPHSTSFDQSYHTVTVSPHDFPSEVPPVFVPLSKVREYLPEGMVILDTKMRIPLALKPFIVLNDQVAMMVFERDDGATTCKECKKVPHQFQASSVSMKFGNDEQRQQEEQATAQRQPLQQQEQRVTYFKQQQMLQDEHGQNESQPLQEEVSPYNETSPQVRHGQTYLNQGRKQQQPSQVLPPSQQQQQQPSQVLPPSQQQQQQQQQHDQTLSYQGKQPQKYEQPPQQQQLLPPSSSQQQHQYQQQQYLQQEQQLNQQPLQNFSPETNQHQVQQQYQQQQQQPQQQQQQQELQQQELNPQSFQNFSPQTNQSITSFPEFTNQDPSRPQQILRSSSLPHLPTGTQQAVAGRQQGQPQPNRLPGLRTPYWMSDESCKSCTNCGKSFSVTRRKHHCRGCGKIFCNDCCNQLAQLPYLGQKIARVCVTCTRTIRKAHFDKAKRKKDEQTRRHSQSSAVSQPSGRTNHSLRYIPNEDMSPSFNTLEPTIPEDNFNVPQRSNDAYQSLPGNFNPASDLAQSMPDVSVSPSPSQVGNSSYNDRMSFDTRSETGRFPGFSQDDGFVGSSWKIPSRPAGRNVTWTNYDSRARLDEQKKRFKNLNKVLKTPEGCVIQTAPKLTVSVKKIQVILKQELHETWLLCSQGFESSGHKEIAFLLEKQINEDVFPYEMLKVYRTLYTLITNQGERFEHGNYLTVNNPVLGSEEFVGFIFMTSDKAPKLVQQHAAGKTLLIGVLLKKTELTCAKYLPTRLFNALGAQQQCFPSPAVSSRDRSSVCNIEPNELFYSTFFALNQFLNHQTPQALIPDVHILKSGSKVVLELPFAYQTEVIGILDSLLIDESKQVTVPIAGDLVPEASGHFVYSPSNVASAQRGFVVLQNTDELPGNQYLAFSAILLVLTFGDACNSRTRFGIEVIEDGITITLSDSQARELRQAIYQGTNCAMSVGNSADSQEQFTLRWTSDTCPSILDIPTPIRVVQNVKKSTKGLFPATTQGSQSQPPAHVDAGQTNVIIERLKTRDIEAAIQTKIASGDPQQAVVKLENDVKQACAGCLLTFANRLRSNAEKRLNLTLALGPDNYKKWSLGPSNQPINLSRALQLALNEVEIPQANDDIVFVFNVILQKRN